jgi:acetate kinase
LDHFRWVEELAGSEGGVDAKSNEEGSGRRRITKEGSRISGWVIETDEELECVQLAVAASEATK